MPVASQRMSGRIGHLIRNQYLIEEIPHRKYDACISPTALGHIRQLCQVILRSADSRA